MNKKFWTRLVLAGVLSTGLFAVAGCGESAEDQKAKYEQMIQKAREQEVKAQTELSDELAKADTWSKAVASLKEKGELKKAPIEVSGSMFFQYGAIHIDVVKPGTTELLRYDFDVKNKSWSDGKPVEVVGTGKKDIARTFYPIDHLNPAMMATVIDSFKKEAQSNPELKDAYVGFFSYVGMGWSPDTQQMFYSVEQLDASESGSDTTRSIDAQYDQNGNLTSLKVRHKGDSKTKKLK